MSISCSDLFYMGKIGDILFSHGVCLIFYVTIKTLFI